MVMASATFTRCWMTKWLQDARSPAVTASMRGCGARPRGRRAGGRVGRRRERGVEGRAGRRSERGVEGGAGRRAGPRQGSQSARGGQVWPGHVARPQRAPWSPALAIPWGGGRRRDTHHRVHGHPHAPGGRALRGRQVGLEGSRRHRGFRPRLLRHRGARGGGEELLLQQEVSGFCWGLRTPPDAWICPNNLRLGPGTGPSGSLPSRSKAKVQTAERSRPFGPGSFGAHLPGRGRAAKGGGQGAWGARRNGSTRPS